MLLTQCPLCEHVNPANSRFCSACGTPLEAMLCPHCGAVNDMTAVNCHKCFGSLLEKKGQALVQARNGGEEAPEASEATVGNGAIHEGPRLPLKPTIASEPTIPASEAETSFNLDRLLVPRLTVPPPSAASMPHQPPVLDSVFADDEEDVAQEAPSSFDYPAEEDTANDDPDAPTEVLETPERKPIPTVRDEIFGHPQPASWVAEPNGFLRRQRMVVVVGVVALAAAALGAYLANREGPGDTRAGQPADAAVGAANSPPGHPGVGSVSESAIPMPPTVTPPDASARTAPAAPLDGTTTPPAGPATPAPAAALPARMPAGPATVPPLPKVPADAAPTAAITPAVAPEPEARKPSARASKRVSGGSRRPPARSSDGALEPDGSSGALAPRPATRSETFAEPPPPPPPAPVAGPCTNVVAALGLCTPSGGRAP